MSNKKQTLLNISAYVILPFFIGVFNIIKMRVFINVLGDTQNGIYQFYTSFFTYFALIESGMELAVCSTLYKYLITKNYEKINEVIAGAKVYWRRFAFGNLIIGAILLPLAPILVGDKPSVFFVIMIQALYTIRSTFNYFFAGPQAMAMADNKGYMVITIDAISTFTSAISAIVMVYLTQNLVYVAFAEVIILLFFVIVKYLYLKKQFPYLNMGFKSKKNFEFTHHLRGTLVTKVTDMFINNTDVFIVTLMFGVEANSWFAIFINFAVLLVSIFGTSITSSFQSLLGKFFADKEYNENVRKENIALLKWLNYIVMLIVIPLIALALNPFVVWFYGEAQIAPFNFYIVFIIFIYFKLLRTPYATLKISMGLYNSFIPYSIANAVLKIILSIILGQFFGMTGVVFGTSIAYVFTELWKEVKIFDFDMLNKPWYKYIFELAIHLFVTIGISVLFICYLAPHINGFFSLFFICLITGILLSAVVFAGSLLISKQLRDFVKQFLGGNRHEEI